MISVLLSLIYYVIILSLITLGVCFVGSKLAYIGYKSVNFDPAIDIKKKTMVGKTVIVTGGNSGIGRAIATGLAYMGAHVILACRSKERTLPVLQQIIEETKNKDVEFMQLDLCSFSSIRRFADEFKQKKYPLHVLINNAGILYLHSSLVQGSDMIDNKFTAEWMSNYLGHFLLTNLLLDVIKKFNGRIVNVTSSMHHFVTLDPKDLQGINSSHFARYSKTKLAQIYFTYELQRRLEKEGSRVTVNAVHPGYIPSDIVSYIGPLNQVLHLIYKHIFGFTAWTGAAGPLYAASSPEMEGKGAMYFSTTYPMPSNKCTYDTKLASYLWQKSEEMIGQ